MAEAAHSFSILAKRDERELAFLLNFIDAKQQQHLSQVQSFFDATSVDSVGKEMGSKSRLQRSSLPYLEQKCVGGPFIRWTRNKLAASSSLHFSQIRELNPNFSHSSELASVSSNSSLPLLTTRGNFLLVSLAWDLFNPNTKMQGMWGAAARDLTRSLPVLYSVWVNTVLTAGFWGRGIHVLFICLMNWNWRFWFSHIKCFNPFCSFV